MNVALPYRKVIGDAVKSHGYNSQSATRTSAWYTKDVGLWTRQIGFGYGGESVEVIYRTDSIGQEPHFVSTLTIIRLQLGDVEDMWVQ
mgnify:CR=1 FL=1